MYHNKYHALTSNYYLQQIPIIKTPKYYIIWSIELIFKQHDEVIYF